MMHNQTSGHAIKPMTPECYREKRAILEAGFDELVDRVSEKGMTMDTVAMLGSLASAIKYLSHLEKGEHAKVMRVMEKTDEGMAENTKSPLY